MRGARISQKAWRIAEQDLDSFVKQQNVSELLFEEYLNEQGLGQPEREPAFPGATKRVDYRLLFSGQVLWFEVKEFADDPRLLDVGFGSFDPYVGIRKKIGKAADKFRDYDGECCSLVLYNGSINLVHICTPQLVLGAMLGNVGIRIPMGLQTGIPTGPAATVFTQGGKLIHPYYKSPQNTTISAVIALERLAVGQREFQVGVAQTEVHEQRRLSYQEFLDLLRRDRAAHDRSVLRTIVYENPYAATPMTRDVFKGPFDERWGSGDDSIGRIHVGHELARLEAQEHALELDLGPLQKMIKKPAAGRASGEAPPAPPL